MSSNFPAQFIVANQNVFFSVTRPFRHWSNQFSSITLSKIMSSQASTQASTQSSTQSSNIERQVTLVHFSVDVVDD
jgi:hypothetical protein